MDCSSNGVFVKITRSGLRRYLRTVKADRDMLSEANLELLESLELDDCQPDAENASWVSRRRFEHSSDTP